MEACRTDDRRMYLLEPNFNMALVQMTNRCNINCLHCYVSSHPYGAFGLSRERLLDLVDELDEQGIHRLALSGGEPLARADECLATLKHAKGRFSLLLLTNAMLITDRIAERIADLQPVVRVSVDGSSAERHDQMRGAGSFVRTMRGIERLLSAGFPHDNLEFFSTLTADAMGEISGILGLAERLGVTRLKFEPVSRTGRAIETWGATAGREDDPDTRLFRQTFETAEIAGPRHSWQVAEIADTAFRVLTIYENGEVYPYTWTDERDRAIGYLGNIVDAPLAEVLDAERVSASLLAKIAMISRGPRRSLRALRLLREPLADIRIVEYGTTS